MSGIKAPILDILTKLTTIGVVNQEGQTVPLYARIWNNQLQLIKDGNTYPFPRPACFVEIINSVNYEIIGLGFRSADIGIRFHLIHDTFNTEGTYEQDLEIFDLRDKILRNFRQYCPTACGAMDCIREEQEYDHDNLYHYVLDFVCCFIDSKGSKYDPSDPDINEVEVELDVEVTKVDSNQTNTIEQEFIIIKK